MTAFISKPYSILLSISIHYNNPLLLPQPPMPLTSLSSVALTLFCGRSICRKNMASGRHCSALFIVMLLLLPSIHSARPRGTTPLEKVEAASPSPAFSAGELLQVQSRGGGAPASLSMEDSVRVVPTGPDPLHHNRNPALRRNKP